MNKFLRQCMALVIIGTGLTPAAPAAAAIGTPISNGEQRVNGHAFRLGAIQGAPDISGGRIVWFDPRGDTPNAGRRSLWSKDLNTRDEARVAELATSFSAPRISGDWVVWEDTPLGNFDIFARPLPGGPVVTVTTDPADQMNPAIDGNLVVWEDFRNVTDTAVPNADIFRKDLTGGTEAPVTTAAGNQVSPAVSGNTVAWRDYRRFLAFPPPPPDVYVRTGSDPETEIRRVPDLGLGFSDFFGHTVAISGSRLVWTESSQVGFQIIRHLMTCVLPCVGDPSPVESAPGSQADPDISGSRVVWTADQETAAGFETHVYAKDLAAGGTATRVDTGLLGSGARIDGTRVVWVNQRSDDPNALNDIYWRDLGTSDPPRRANSPGMGPFGHYVNPAASGDNVVYRAPGGYGRKPRV